MVCERAPKSSSCRRHDGAVVDGAPARLIAVVLHRDRSRRRVRIGPPGDGLTLGVRAQILALEIAQFIVWVEVLSGQARPALQADDLHARLAELGCEDTACRARADDDNIGFFGCHGSHPPVSRLWPAGRRWGAA